MSAPVLTSDAIAWNRKHIALWSARADEHRARGGLHALNLAHGLDMVVAGMRSALAGVADAAPAPQATQPYDDQIARLEARLAACQPCLYPGTDIMTGLGPIMDNVRHNLRVKIAMLRGEAIPEAPAPALPPVILPPAEALPFTAGPQLDLFGGAA